jgi:endonuclease/exonuclease/phosphatase family metal-dependent hydrolase
MTTILSWNIQNGLGVDGLVSVKRISETIKNICDPDVICLQEVSVNMLLPDGHYSDQVSELASEFIGYEALFGVAIDVSGSIQGKRGQYGNMVLSRYPVRSVFHHPLPQPVDGSRKQMPRQMTEVTVETPAEPLRIMATHLEFHSQKQRLAQATRIRDIEIEVGSQAAAPPTFAEKGPYSRFERASSSVLCGDFNFLLNSKEYDILTKPENEAAGFHDVWTIANAGQDHAPTCGVFDQEQWPQGAHCRDFMFVTEELTGRIESMAVDTTTNASDHQPLVMVLSEDLH